MKDCIQTARTDIRPYTEEDIPRIYPILSDPITMRFWPKPLTLEQIEQWVRQSIQEHAETGLGRMIIELRETGEIIGDCGIRRAKINGTPENDLGYIIHAPFWRKGLATECAGAIFENGKKKGLHRLVANMAHDHIGSQRVAEKLGMKLETTFQNPRNRDLKTYLYSWEY